MLLHQFVFLALLFLGFPFQSQASKLHMKLIHQRWMTQYNKNYSTPEEQAYRLTVFSTNFDQINEFNKKDHGYSLASNNFADLTSDEIKARYLGIEQEASQPPGQAILSPPLQQRRRRPPPPRRRRPPPPSRPAEVFDWRRKGAVNPVKDQRYCNAGWAFAAVAAMEGIAQIKRGLLRSFSEEEIINCNIYSSGCNGGFIEDAYKWVIQNKGINSDANYPYTGYYNFGYNQPCNQNLAAVSAANFTSYDFVTPNNETALRTAVLRQPISITIDASSFNFMFYSGGIFTGPCGFDKNHAVAVIGFGVTTFGTPYWILRNSWNYGWGELGYMRILRNYIDPRGLCGVAQSPSYPIV